jgi:UDP:flavonoid glycosyltransferase YjiC (YdhE family)
MRAYFAPCGIGLGHVGRSVPIARALISKGMKVTFSTYTDGIGYIQRERLPLCMAPPIGFQVKPDGSIDFRQTAANPGPFVSVFTFLRQVNFELASIGTFKPDVIVSDSRASPLVAARILGLPRICILNQFQVFIPRRKRFLRLARLADYGTLTLIGKIWTSQTVLIPDFPAPYTISTGNLHIPKAYRKNVKLIGPVLPVTPYSLPPQSELRKRLQLSNKKICIFVPMSGPYRERAFFTENLKQILLSFPQEYEITVSLGYPHSKRKPLRHDNITIYDWIPNRFEYMKACDFVIARAGHGTITQCMCYGKPAIFIPTPNHTEQLNNAQQASKLRTARVIRQEKTTKEVLLATIKEMFEDGVSERAASIALELSKYDGLKNAVDAIQAAATK